MPLLRASRTRCASGSRRPRKIASARNVVDVRARRAVALIAGILVVVTLTIHSDAAIILSVDSKNWTITLVSCTKYIGYRIKRAMMLGKSFINVSISGEAFIA